MKGGGGRNQAETKKMRTEGRTTEYDKQDHGNIYVIIISIIIFIL